AGAVDDEDADGPVTPPHDAAGGPDASGRRCRVFRRHSREAMAVPGRLPLRRAVAAAAVAVVASVLLAPPAGAGGDGIGTAAVRPPVRRVLILSLPGTTWADVAGADVPHLDALFAAAAVGSTSVRGIRRHTLAGDGYATIGAGTAAAGVAAVDGLAFDAGECRQPPPGIAPYCDRTSATDAPVGIVSVATPDLAGDA